MTPGEKQIWAAVFGAGLILRKHDSSYDYEYEIYHTRAAQEATEAVEALRRLHAQPHRLRQYHFAADLAEMLAGETTLDPADGLGPGLVLRCECGWGWLIIRPDGKVNRSYVVERYAGPRDSDPVEYRCECGQSITIPESP